MPKAVLFDFKDTLAFVAEDGPTLAEVSAAQGFALQPVVADARAEATLTSDAGSESAFWAEVRRTRLEALKANGVPTDGAEEIVDEVEAGRGQLRMELFPEVRGVLDHLRDRGVAMGVCSNWDWHLEQHISRLGIDEYFQVVVGSARCGYWKPHERIFRLALEGLRADPADTFFVGDNLRNDVIPAVALGMRALHLHRRGPCQGKCAWGAEGLAALLHAL